MGLKIVWSPRALEGFDQIVLYMKRNLYRGPINRLTILTYRINRRRNIIELVNIRPAKQESSDE